MYVIAKTTKLKKVGAIYKEEVEEKHYKHPIKVETTSRMVLITYREANGTSGEVKETTDAIGVKDIVGISVYE